MNDRDMDLIGSWDDEFLALDEDDLEDADDLKSSAAAGEPLELEAAWAAFCARTDAAGRESGSRHTSNPVIGPYDAFCGGKMYLLQSPPLFHVGACLKVGVFEETAMGAYVFRAADDCFPVEYIHPALKSFTRYLMQNDQKVELYLWPGDEGLLMAFDMKLGHRSGLWEEDKDQPLFELFLTRLFMAGGKSPQKGAALRPIFTGLGHMEFLLMAGREMFPEHIADWADQQLAIARDRQKDSDTRKHAQRALEYILNIDWQPRELRLPPPKQVREILDEEFYGLGPVKDRVEEIIAQIRRSGKMPKWGILLSGPPGVGKSTIAYAIARILSMPVVRLDMSTIEDSEGLVGSSRLYSNGRPGIVIEQLRQVGTNNVTVCINEIDKSSGVRGNPGDTLLTLLDGLGFMDVFIETVIPTDGMFFVATCNDVDKISRPLQDRFLRIEIPAYSALEKECILKKHVLPRTMQAAAMSASELTLEDDAVTLLCSDYATEPGVRDLEQICEKLVSHYVLKIDNGGQKSYCCTAEDIRGLLGPSSRIARSFCCQPGLVRSAFFHGGRAHEFPVEAVVMPGTGAFRTVGIEGNSLKAYCEAAYYSLRCNNKSIDLSRKDVVVYVPQPIPADEGNFLGVAVYAAMYSALTETSYPAEVAFLGGCDMRSNAFFDATDATPYIVALMMSGVKTIYAPVGCGRLVFGGYDARGTRVLEYDDVDTMVKMATYDHSLAIDSAS